MPIFRNPRFLVPALLLLTIPSAWLALRDAGAEDNAVVAIVQRGEFVVTVTTSGELGAKESVRITGPSNTRQAEVYQLKIASIVPEGTVVAEGDIVAELDRSTVASKLAEVTLALQKAEAVYEQAMLDSTLTLSQARDEIGGLELAVEEKRLAKEQSVYEPPTVQRQAEIEYEKAGRAAEQAKVDYKTKVEQAQAKMREVGADLERERNKLAIVRQVMDGFTVRAPAPGMVIYVKEWNGRKRTTGSQVSSWDPTVATLPDLTQMESVTYVNEVDIRRISMGQAVALTLDSDPSKRLTGTVTAVANVGEQRPNTDAKVFEVHIVVSEADTTLRPGMTTGNAIETLRRQSVLSVPIEALGSEDGIPFVYLQSGNSAIKQEVVTGPMNDMAVVIERGVEEGNPVLLSPPANPNRHELQRLPDSPASDATEDGAAPVTGGDTAVDGRSIPLEANPRSRN